MGLAGSAPSLLFGHIFGHIRAGMPHYAPAPARMESVEKCRFDGPSRHSIALRLPVAAVCLLLKAPSEMPIISMILQEHPEKHTKEFDPILTQDPLGQGSNHSSRLRGGLLGAFGVDLEQHRGIMPAALRYTGTPSSRRIVSWVARRSWNRSSMRAPWHSRETRSSLRSPVFEQADCICEFAKRAN